jgi:hypothetical protein
MLREPACQAEHALLVPVRGPHDAYETVNAVLVSKTVVVDYCGWMAKSHSELPPVKRISE